MSGVVENNKLVFKGFNIEKYEFINFISISEYRWNCRICVAFSYSRYENKDNYKLAERQRTINDVHAAVTRIFRSITGLALTSNDLEVLALDISNQLEVENIRNYYNVLNLIYRAYKHVNPNGCLYFDTDKEQRLELDGVDFKEGSKKRREANTYFKIYSKRKEIEDTKGAAKARGKRQALRGELTLKGVMLKKYDLHIVGNINKVMLERTLKDFLAGAILDGINKELEFDTAKLIAEYQAAGSKKIQEVTLMNLQYIFDIELLDRVITAENLGVAPRTASYHKKNIKELLKVTEGKSEIKRVFSKNFERLAKLLKKIIKVDVRVEKGALKWQ